ncbi:hypothetical protein POL68_23865 [Stigmatella sp. ncwal1]|uniref:Uncharacterized protein n=1 Tax=Stigmatella ashevillensis TaxID=2995309 RepID=A0ABT5DFF4_9BACT|nr:hypothetical protein [Stigmatella ashevillena]MDC0711528.1 hypothetical protein [Stigmatella ashevillena]
MRSGATAVYELVSASGARVACVVFLVLSLGLAAGLYAVLVRASGSRAVFREEPLVRGSVATVASLLLFSLLFGTVYATLLSGFYRVELNEEEVLLHYLFPSHIVTLQRVELAEVEGVALLPGRWSLRLHTHQGDTYPSALAQEPVAFQSWQALNAYLEGNRGGVTPAELR